MSSESIYKPTWLYIKQHSVTGLKYFGKTIRNPNLYRGSGKYWIQHINKHGVGFVTTLWTEKFESKEDLVEFSLFFSEFHDIVSSIEWANLMIENGLDGGGISGIKRKPHSNETKRKISCSNIGRICSAETRIKLRKKRGPRTSPSKPFSPEHIENLKIARSKREPPSKESREKMSKSAKERCARNSNRLPDC